MRVAGELLARGALRLRGLREQASDFELLVRWLSDPRIQEWYGDSGRSSRQIEEDYRARLAADDPVRPCMVEWQGEPIGYLQFYPVAEAEDYQLDHADATWGIDLFLGEPGHWSGGIGSELLAATIEYLCLREAVARVVIDPRVDNARAIRCYEKAGFRKLALLARHERHEGEWRDSWLMVCEVGGSDAALPAARGS